MNFKSQPFLQKDRKLEIVFNIKRFYKRLFKETRLFHILHLLKQRQRKTINDNNQTINLY